MSKYTSPLKDLKVASPCPANWGEMYGGERKRFCGGCQMNVYNLSGMTKAEAENLILGSEGRLCVRFYQRADGTVITKDCPVGWAKVKQRLSRTATAVFSVLTAFTGGLLAMNMFGSEFRERLLGELVAPDRKPTPKPSPSPKPMPDTEAYPLMGAVALPLPPKPTPKPSPQPQTPKTKNTDPRGVRM